MVQTSQALIFPQGFGKVNLELGKRSSFMSEAVSKSTLAAGIVLAMEFTFIANIDSILDEQPMQP
jgi:hypothetical protein